MEPAVDGQNLFANKEHKSQTSLVPGVGAVEVLPGATGVDANPVRYLYERVGGGSRTRWGQEWSWDEHTQVGS